MVTARKSTVPYPPDRVPAPPPRQPDPIIHAGHSIKDWLNHYWQKLNLPANELNRLAITQDRQEYMRWTGKRLQSMVLGCYCYLPAPRLPAHTSTRGRKPALTMPLPTFEEALQLHLPSHRHLIFIEPDMQPQSIEVTVDLRAVTMTASYSCLFKLGNHTGCPPFTRFSSCVVIPVYQAWQAAASSSSEYMP